MEDLADVLRQRFLTLHHRRSMQSGKVKERVVKMKEQRKHNRQDVMFGKRKIPEDMTPISTPGVKREKLERRQEVEEKLVSKRLAMLAQWKLEKEIKKKQHEEKKKPLFKVTHVPVSIGLPNLESVNRQIKGKPFKSKFAPANHKFKPPSNIRPLDFKYAASASNGIKPKDVTEINLIMTRSRTRNLVQPSTVTKEKRIGEAKEARSRTRNLAQPSTVTKEKRIGEAKEVKRIIKTNTESRFKNNAQLNPKEHVQVSRKVHKPPSKSKPVSPKRQTRRTPSTAAVEQTKPKVQKTPRKEIQNQMKGLKKEELQDNGKTKGAHNKTMSPDFPGDDESTTPNKVDPPVYISPFITISRGKDSARKEYSARKSQKFTPSKSQIAEHISPKAGAAYFTWILDSHMARLEEVCDKWSKFKEEENPPEEAVSMIDVAMGQTNLLITKKFVQFRGLIEKCNDPDAMNQVKCEDLHGFWDMIYIQVKNLDTRFENLHNLRANCWHEVLPEGPKKAATKKTKSFKNSKPSAGLKEAIEAARRKKQTEIVSNVKQTPQKRRSSCRVSNITYESSRKNSSPGLMMMKVAQYAKDVGTPAKSILKNDGAKSVKSHSKSVLFKDEAETDENDLNKSNVQTRGKTPTRRSRRLSTKLF